MVFFLIHCSFMVTVNFRHSTSSESRRSRNNSMSHEETENRRTRKLSSSSSGKGIRTGKLPKCHHKTILLTSVGIKTRQIRVTCNDKIVQHRYEKISYGSANIIESERCQKNGGGSLRWLFHATNHQS